ncbi:hypothetical protein [Ruminococcus sp.]|uniref:hypothetical protein n=1 Tax=Ruminococcus sp. TaxID=41978 RepID=UPI0025D0AF25|nr:hypothetical protein [Ruminococcus sp.]MCR4639792.1 hypothetical protein [Ruminococcus sp.]
MTDFRKKAIALAAVACVAITSAASCSKKEAGSASNKTSSTGNSSVEQATAGNMPTLENIENASGAVVVTPFQTGSPADLANLGLTLPDGVDLNSDDPQTKSTTQPATEVVEVTQANGEKATDANGAVVTEIVTKPTEASGEYTSKTDSRYCMWLDISKDSDYVFNGDFIEVVFKLKDNIPNKDYPVRFNPDFATVAGKSIAPDKVIQGNIKVGGDIEEQNVSSETGFVAYGDNVSAKPGDEITYHINLKNNPGLAAMLVWVYYDSNAMEVEGIYPSGEFEKFASTATTGEKPKN